MSNETKHIICYFNELGYRIESVETQEVLFQSGNHRYDDHAQVQTNSHWAIPIQKILEFGSKTAIQMAIEKELEYVGAEYEAINDSEENKNHQVSINAYLSAHIPQFMFIIEFGQGMRSYN